MKPTSFVFTICHATAMLAASSIPFMASTAAAASAASAASPISVTTVTSTDAATETVRWTFDGDILNNSLALSPDESTAVASYSVRPEVVVYDLKTGQVRGVLQGFITPRNIVFSPYGNVFYVSDSSLGTVSLVDTASLKILSTLPVGPGAFGTVLTKDGATLYVNNQAANTVTRFDLKKNQPLFVVTGFSQPRQGVRLRPDGQILYVTNFLGDKISVVSTATNKIEGEITGFNKLRGLSITADGKTLFAANSGNNTVAVTDLDKHVISANIPVGKDPYGAALAPDGQHVYVGNLGDNSLSVIEVKTQKVVATITGFKEPRQAIVFNRDGKTAYVLNEDLSLAKVDLANNRIDKTLMPPALTPLLRNSQHSTFNAQ